MLRSRRVLGLLWAAGFALCAFVTPASAAPQPVESFGLLPNISDLRLSPDGKHMAALQIYQGRVIVVIYEVGAPPGTMPAILADDRHFIKSVRWGSNERLLVTIYDIVRDPQRLNHKYPAYRYLSVDTKAQNPVFLLNNSSLAAENPDGGTIVDLDLDDPDHIYMALYGRHYDDYSYDVYKVDLTTGRGELALRGPNYINGGTNAEGYLYDGHGKPVARLDRSHDPLEDHVMLYKDGNWTKAASYSAQGDSGAGVAGLTVDGTKLVQTVTFTDPGTEGLLTRDLASAEQTALWSNPSYDLDGPVYDEWTGRVIGARYVDDVAKTVYLEPAMQALQRGVQGVFPANTNVVITSMTLDRNMVTVAASSPDQPPSYYMLNRTTHLLGRVGAAYPKVTQSDLGTVKRFDYKARDGLSIAAYLTLPPGKAPSKLPVVVMPHGGPDVRDSMDFDWWAQFLANRGYAVLQPNYRGSSGYGRKFTEAGLKQWGLKIQDDVSDGVQKMIADGIADPKRICIVGASFGGYVALAGAAFTPDLYACAVSYAGVSDLPLMLETTADEDGGDSRELSFWQSRMGTMKDDEARLKDRSPANHADAVKCPILLLHGEGDFTVRIDQSELMAKKLKSAGKAVTLIRFKHDDHYLQRSETRIQMLSEIEKFLAQNIGN